MTDKQRGVSFWGVGLLLPILVQAVGLPEGLLRDAARLGSWFLFVIGGVFYARAKGYRGLLGGALGFFHILGAVILILLPRKLSTP